MRPIDADELLKNYENIDWYSVSEKGGLMGGATTEDNPLIHYYDGEEIIKNTPTIDVADVDKALEWLEGYTLTDTKQVYTNGTVLVPMFRVRQALKDKAYNGLMEG